MNISQIETNLTHLANDINKKSFIFDFLIAYGIPKSTITLLKKGNRNLSGREDRIILKRKVFFQEAYDQDLHEVIDDLLNDDRTFKHDPRFIIVTDYKTLLAVDLKTEDTLEINIKKINKHFDFFLPWAGMEKAELKTENPADIKAAEKMAKLYDEILKENKFKTKGEIHRLNKFLSRLLFCYFAEDTGIFSRGIFTLSVSSHTRQDGSDLGDYLNKLFEFLNIKDKDRSKHAKFLKNFPYVNGGLFEETFYSPKFTSKSRNMIIECGELDWSAINPDIFGSMIQAVVHTDQRSEMGIHYTSVPNIMKVIEPLFLNDLKDAYIKSYNNKNKLMQLLTRLENINIFDPACGSGNFLIISYKEIRKLEIEVFKRIKELQNQIPFAQSRILLSNFYGIELDDFACESAVLSLWLAEHQMNILFKETFGDVGPALPLKAGGNIHQGNATQIDWELICPKKKDREIYIIGNPPYLGARQQSIAQKNDIKACLHDIKGANNLDYISCWFYKSAKYISNITGAFAFVTTNSLCQGTQVSLLWPHILDNGLEISFAHTSFKWTNNAKKNAGVTCAIIGIRKKNNKEKYIYNGPHKCLASHINAYLVDADDVYIEARNKSISALPAINYGSFALDDGNYTLTESDKNSILKINPKAAKYIKQFIGAKELIYGIKRYCIWIGRDELKNAKEFESIAERISNVKKWRSTSSRESTRKLAGTPHMFAEIRQPKINYIAFPTVSSERREYIPVEYLDSKIIASNQIYIIPTTDTYVFGILASKMHMIWTKATAGRLKTDIRYSASVCYNNFPVPKLTEKQIENIKVHVFRILEEREKHSEKVIADLYDPDKMPKGLRKAHSDLDIAIENCYRSKPFSNDEERLEHLFKLYEQMISTLK